jgi:hypothetical protein
MKILLFAGSLVFLLSSLFCACDPGADGTRADANRADGEGEAAEMQIELPPIEGYLSCKPSKIDGQGEATLKPSAPIPIGSVATFEVTFTVGEAGIAPRGFVIFQISPWWGWSEPQLRVPEGAGYSRVETSFEDPDLRILALNLSRILVFSETRRMEPGDRITFEYGPARVDRYAEREELFQVFVDADGDGHYACIAEPPVLKILPLSADTLSVNGPSRAVPGDRIRIQAAALDGAGNWTAFPRGRYTLKVPDGKNGSLEEQHQDVEEGAASIFFDLALPEEGLFFFHVEGPNGIAGRSNVLLCQEGAPSLNLYFGDIHGHTRLSDGTGTPEDHYRFCDQVSGLDIAAVTDHSDYGTIPLQGAAWNRIKRAANDAYRPGDFVTFLGFEWTNWVSGHRNVYYRDGDGPIFRSFDEHSDTPEELWKLIEPYEAMTIAHHVGGGPISIDWSIPPPADREWLVEICSIHGSSEVYRSSRDCVPRPVQGRFVRDALNMGYKLGIIASGDTHDGHPGKRSMGAVVTGILGVYAPELTREAIWEAFKRRQVYGTSGPKIILFFRVADSPMGSEVTWSADQGGIPIALRTVTCDEIAALEIVRNGEVVLRHEPEEGGVFAQFLVEDTDPVEGTNWYYARVVQKDGNMAWSSPVWVFFEKGE